MTTEDSTEVSTVMEYLLEHQLESAKQLWETNKFSELLKLCDTTQNKLPTEYRNHRDALRMLYFRTKCLHKAGRLTEAWTAWEDVYHRQSDSIGANSNDTLDTLRQMGRTASRLLEEDNNEEPMKVWLSLREKREEKQLEALENTVVATAQIANKLKQEGRSDKALELYDQLYFTLVDIRGETDPLTLRAMKDKADILPI